MALGYVSFAQQVYQTSSLLRPAAINELDALNRSQVYTLPAADALLKVGLALESYENRLSFSRPPGLVQTFGSTWQKSGAKLRSV